MSNKVSIAQATRIISKAYKNRKRNGGTFKVLMLGPPGVAKTATARQIAQSVAMPCVEWLLSNKPPEHITGYPYLKDGVMHYAQPVSWPTEPCVLLIDELGQCPIQVQNVAMPVVYEGTNGVHTLPDGTMTIACANRAEDRAGSTVLQTALRTRFDIILEIEPTKAEWLDWAKAVNANPFLVAWVEGCLDSVVKFDPKSKDGQRNPRTLEQTGDLLDMYGSDCNNPDLKAVLYGVLPQDDASGLLAFMETYDQLPLYDDIRDDPDNASVSEEHLSMIAGLLRDNARYVHGAAIVRYIMRYRAECQARLVTALTDNVRKHPEVKALAETLALD
jgi:hypothetical protein